MNLDASGIWLLLSFTLIVSASSLFQSGCTDMEPRPDDRSTERRLDHEADDRLAEMLQDREADESMDQGGTKPVIHLPFRNGKSSKCVQGVNGAYSHNTVSTKYDIDLDTSNTEKEELFSPVSGTAYVHMEDLEKNYGAHLNIDLGNGTYVILAHLSEIFVQNGQQISAGQLIGHEGCTGYCSGDHVHIGLHKGDAKKMAQYGESVEVSYLFRDTASGDSVKVLKSSSLVCGIKTAGDKTDGVFYTSVLPVPLWHPEGTLIKSPVSPKVYLVQKGETLSWIVDEKAFLSRGYDFKHVVLVSKEEISCYASGANTSGTGTPPPGNATFHEGKLLKETSHSDVYVMTGGVAAPIESWHTFLLLGYQAKNIQTISDGDLANKIGSVGNCPVNLWCLQKNTAMSCGGNGFYTEDAKKPDVKEPVEIRKPKPTTQSSKDDVWLNDYGLDGAQETLMVWDSRWLNANLSGKDAFVYGIGGCFDHILTEADRVKSENGYYQIDFSKFSKSCIGELTLVSSVGTDGQPPNANMTNWYWWQGAAFCYEGSPLCQLKKNNTSWEEWLLRVSWNVSNGLQPAGNGFTKNTQLK